MTPTRFFSAVLLLSTVASTSAIAAGGTGSYRLPWHVHGQVLEYRSCGCADSCWTAEVIHSRTKAVLARLHCDCEHLSFSKAQGPVQQLPQACAVLDDKPAFIRQTLEPLLAPQEK